MWLITFFYEALDLSINYGHWPIKPHKKTINDKFKNNRKI